MDVHKFMIVLCIAINCVESGRPKMCNSDISSLEHTHDESLYLIESFRAGLDNPEKNEGKVTAITDHVSCPSQTSRAQKGSMCPGYRVINFDPNRIPSIIVEIQCACLQCLHASNQTSTNACQPVFYYRYVLEMPKMRRTKKRCFERVLRGFKVGCECMTPELVSSEKPIPLNG